MSYTVTQAVHYEFVYLSVRVALRTWDALVRAADGVTSGQSLQLAGDFGSAESLFKMLESVLEMFEVSIAS